MNYQPQMQKELTNPGMNTASMVVGIIGLLMAMIPVFGLPAPSIAIMLALLGRGNQMQLRGHGLAGLILGILGLVANFAFTILLICFVLANAAMLGSF